MICRPILLHNEFMPTKTGERKWDYRVFGYHDGMTIKESIEFNKSASLKEIFELCVNNEEAMQPYFTQFLFCFHPDKDSEDRFWKCELPFTYLCLLQFVDSDVEAYRNYLESEEYLKKELEIFKCQEEQVSVAAYYSLDNSDLILIIKCEKSKTGAELINDLHHNAGKHPFKLRNSYSVLTIKSEDIDDPDKFSENEEVIDLIELRIVERDIDSIGRLYLRLKTELEKKNQKFCIERKSLLGTEDESIIIRNLRWKELIPYYRSKTGILNNSNECSQRYANATSTKIMYPLKDTDILQKNVFKRDSGRRHRLLGDLIYEEIKDTYSGRKDQSSRTEKKNLIMFTNALRRFEYTDRSERVFSDYNFYPMFFPFYTFVKLLKKHTGDFARGYYDFMKGMKLCTQNFTKPDRVYSQITDFNMRYFDIPVKLVTICNAYMYYLKKGLNTNSQYSYEFLICPGVNSKTLVRELLPNVSENERLFIVEIPERQMYDPKLMFIVLGHETAHFVGRKIRMRKERMSSIISTCSRAVSIAMKNYIKYRNGWGEEEISNPKWQLLEQNLNEWIEFYIKSSCNMKFMRNNYYYDDITDEMLQENVNFNRKFCDHADVLHKILYGSIRDLLLDKGENIFGFVIQKGLKGNIDFDARDKYYEHQGMVIGNCICAFVNDHDNRSTGLTLEKVLENIMYLMKECYADVVAILTLEISPEDYLCTFAEIVEADDKSWEDVEDSIMIVRIAIVMTVLNYGMKEKRGIDEGFSWTADAFDRIEYEDAIKLEQCAVQFIKEYIKEDFDAASGIIKPEEMIRNSMNVVCDSQIIREITKYLLKCRERYNEVMKSNEENVKNIEHARKFYSISQMNNADEFFPIMMNLLYEYERDVYRDIDKVIK